MLWQQFHTVRKKKMQLRERLRSLDGERLVRPTPEAFLRLSRGEGDVDRLSLRETPKQAETALKHIFYQVCVSYNGRGGLVDGSGWQGGGGE